MILCWSRWRLWWFTTSVDREHTFEGIVRFFDAAGGVPQLCRTDRMGALGPVAGPPVRAAPADVGVRPRITAPRSRPVRRATRNARARSSGRSVDLQRDVPARGARRHRHPGRSRRAEPSGPSCGSTSGCMTGRTARRVWRRSTGSPPSTASCQPLPRRRFDTDYVEVAPGASASLPFIEWRRRPLLGARRDCLGQLVEVRRGVDADEFDGRAGPAGSSPPTASRPATRRRCGIPSIAPPPRPSRWPSTRRRVTSTSSAT